jgi:hypothetical protein
MTEHHSEAKEGPRFVYSARLESNGTSQWSLIEIVVPRDFDWKKHSAKLLQQIRSASNLFFRENENGGDSL